MIGLWPTVFGLFLLGALANEIFEEFEDGFILDFSDGKPVIIEEFNF